MNRRFLVMFGTRRESLVFSGTLVEEFSLLSLKFRRVKAYPGQLNYGLQIKDYRLLLTNRLNVT